MISPAVATGLSLENGLSPRLQAETPRLARRRWRKPEVHRSTPLSRQIYHGRPPAKVFFVKIDLDYF